MTLDVAVFSTRAYDRDALDRAVDAAEADIGLRYFEARLTADTVGLAEGCGAVCVFVNDDVDAEAVNRLRNQGVRGIVTRSAGFNHIDLDAAENAGLPVLRVPAYGPRGVAEHALALMMTLNRRTHRAFNRTREGNFNLEGLLGFEMHGKTAGVVGTGLIGSAMCDILLGLGCDVLAFDTSPSDTLREKGVRFVELDDLWPACDIVTLHCPLLDSTRHLINTDTLDRLPDHAMVINTSRGGLVDTRAALSALREKRLGALGIDVYEEEEGLFFEDHGTDGLTDELLAQLVALPDVLVTGHQAFFTREAVDRIATTTVNNLAAIANNSVDEQDTRVKP